MGGILLGTHRDGNQGALMANDPFITADLRFKDDSSLLQRSRLRRQLQAAGFWVRLLVESHGIGLNFQGRGPLFEWLFGVDLKQVLISDASGTQTAEYVDASSGAAVTQLTFKPGFPAGDAVSIVVLSSWVAAAPLPHATVPPTPPPAYRARDGKHDPDVPGELAVEPWFVYPYEIRAALDRSDPRAASVGQPQSSRDTVINIVDSGVDVAHPYIVSRWGPATNIHLVRADHENALAPTRIDPALVQQLSAVKAAFATMIATGSGTPPAGLQPGAPLRIALQNIQHQATQINEWVDYLWGQEANLSKPGMTLDTVKAVDHAIGGVLHWLRESLSYFARHRPADLPDDLSGHGTQMVVSAKSVARDATVVAWQKTSAPTVGWPVGRRDQLRAESLASFETASTPHPDRRAVAARQRRPRQILSCSWGEPVGPPSGSVPDSAIRALAVQTVQDAVKRGHLVVFAAGNATNPEAPKVSCFAETGKLGTLVVGGGWWNGDWTNPQTRLTLADSCHGYVDQQDGANPGITKTMPEPVPNILGLCGPVWLSPSSGGGAIKAAPYVILPASQNMATHKDYWESHVGGVSLGVWNRYYGGSSAAAAQVAGAAAVLWDWFPVLSAADVKSYLIRGATGCMAGSSYQGLPWQRLTAGGVRVGLVNLLKSFELLRSDLDAGLYAPPLVAALEPIH